MTEPLKAKVIAELAEQIVRLRAELEAVKDYHESFTENIQMELALLSSNIDGLLAERDFFQKAVDELGEMVEWYHTRFQFLEAPGASLN